MNITFKHTWLALVALLSLSLSSVTKAAPDAGVGEVIFTVGEVKVLGSNAPLKRGDALAVGQTLLTGSNGHVHIRFIDQAFVSVRPGSELRIEQYAYDQTEPKNNRIKFSLVKGTSRFITGKAGQAAKQNFRLNTPVAAVGIRGTDFVAQVANDVTRVAVQQGGVSVSPFNQDCMMQALGACGGLQSRDLAGSLTGQFLEVQARLAPQLILPALGKQPFALPRPEEPSVGGATDSKKTLSESSGFSWGRYAGTAVAPTGYEMVGQNDAFVLYRLTDQMVLPTNGFVSFSLADAKALGQVGDGAFEPATISNPSMAVNFNTMKYATRFTWSFDGITKNFYNAGSVSADGLLTGNPVSSNIRISGALSNNGEEAAYLFSKRYSDLGVRAYGILRWQQ
jgi:hypothetical protein